jgi:hypothetical protein
MNRSGLGGIGCAVQLGVFAVILIGGVMVLQALLGAPGNLLSGLVSAPPPTPTVTVLPPAIDVIRQQPRLETASYFMSTVVDVSQHVGLLQQEQRVIVVVCGQVTAGIDLSKLTEANVSVKGSTVVIQLPDAEMFGASLLEDRNPPCTYTAYRTDGILLESAKNLESEARVQALARMQTTALDNDILGRARESARTELRRLLFLVGYRSVEFVP